MHKFEVVNLSEHSGLDLLEQSFHSSELENEGNLLFSKHFDDSLASTDLDKLTSKHHLSNARSGQRGVSQQQVKVTMIVQVNLHIELANTFAHNLMQGTLKAALKNGVIEFFSSWQSYLQEQKKRE